MHPSAIGLTGIKSVAAPALKSHKREGGSGLIFGFTF